METPRFRIIKNFGGMKFIEDTKDNTLVAMLYGATKPEEQLEAMHKVILDALNRAGAPKLKADASASPEVN